MAKLAIRGVQYFIEQWNEQEENVLVLLHGFTGSIKTWYSFIEQLPSNIRVVAIDLLGHGQTESPANYKRYEMAEQLADLHEIFNLLQLHRFTLLGYSMGGRVALSYAVTYPDRVRLLFLESASPGLLSEQERVERKLADNILADKIELMGIEEFVSFWENIPLFDSQKRLSIEQQNVIRQERLLQNERGLANSLRGLGTGVQPPVWEQLHLLTMPVQLITGSADIKFCLIAERMLQQMPTAKHDIVNEVGHAIHVENLAQFATIVKEQLFLS